VETKLTLVTVRTDSKVKSAFYQLPVDPDGKVRVQSSFLEAIARSMGIKRGECYRYS
jgi:hypothetical protein